MGCLSQNISNRIKFVKTLLNIEGGNHGTVEKKMQRKAAN